MRTAHALLGQRKSIPMWLSEGPAFFLMRTNHTAANQHLKCAERQLRLSLWNQGGSIWLSSGLVCRPTSEQAKTQTPSWKWTAAITAVCLFLCGRPGSNGLIFKAVSNPFDMLNPRTWSPDKELFHTCDSWLQLHVISGILTSQHFLWLPPPSFLCSQIILHEKPDSSSDMHALQTWQDYATDLFYIGLPV